MKNGNWIWLIIAAILLGQAIIALVGGDWKTFIIFFLLAAAFCYAGFR